jgi:hypothetical protein
MPIYDYRCNCGNKIKDVFTKNDIVRCSKCGAVMDKDYSNHRVGVKGDIEEHYDISLGVVVKSRRHLREVLWERNARTDDITPAGGLTPEERDIKSGVSVGDRRSIFEKRKNPNWGTRPDKDGNIDTESVVIA